MGWRFRTSFKLLPGVRLHVSSRGVSTTIGGSALSVNIGPRGTYANVGIPGTGISYRERLTITPEDAGIVPRSPTGTAIESASTYELASEALTQFHRLLVDAGAEQRALDAEIAVVWPDAAAKSARFQRWNNGFLFKHLFKNAFQRIWTEAHGSAAHLVELQEQRKLAAVATTIEVAPEQQRPFGRVCDAFSQLSASQRIWDTLSIRRADQVRERTIAVHTVERQPVQFRLGGSTLLTCGWNVPHLANANGGDLYLYPGFLLYQVTRESFAVIDVRDVRVSMRQSRFIEEERVPDDAEVVGETWKKTNKDGSPDRRFASNYRIPIARYAEITFTSPTGLQEQYMISNYAAAEQFLRSWNAYTAVFAAS